MNCSGARTSAPKDDATAVLVEWGRGAEDHLLPPTAG
jgi:hypothetical protein